MSPSGEYLEHVLRRAFGKRAWDALAPEQSEYVLDQFAMILADPGPHGYNPDWRGDADRLAEFIAERLRIVSGRGAPVAFARACAAHQKRERLRSRFAELRHDEHVSPGRVACVHPGCTRAQGPGEESDEAWDQAVRFSRWLPADAADPSGTDLLCPEHRPTGPVLALPAPLSPVLDEQYTAHAGDLKLVAVGEPVWAFPVTSLAAPPPIAHMMRYNPSGRDSGHAVCGDPEGPITLDDDKVTCKGCIDGQDAQYAEARGPGA
jgi:hypothetical protein